MILTSSSESIKVVLSGAVATNQLQCYISYRVSIDGLDPENRSFALTNNTTAVTLLAGYSAASGIPTEVLGISIFNSDTAAATPSVNFATPESGTYVLFKKELQPGESLQYTKEAGFFLGNELATGAATEAKQDVQILDFNTKTGSLTEVAPATDTASSGLNGRLQRIAQRITSLIALLPSSLGQKSRTASFAVTLSTDDVTALTPITKPFSLDAAFRQRMSVPTTLGEYKMLNNVFASLILEKAGTGTFTDNTNRVTMSVTSGQYAVIQSKQYHPYFNGKSQLIEMTTAGMGTAANVEKSIGYISSTAVAPYATGLDGFRLFKSTGDVYSIQVWRNGSNTINVLRSSWYDKLDGTGPSGMTINWDNFNVFFFDFLYLGGTALRVFTMYNGEPILVNVYYYANSDTTPIFFSPNKPIRYEIRSTTGSGNMDFICSLVASEGDGDVEGTTVTINAPNAGITPLATGTTYALCGVRKASTQRDIFAEVKNFEGVISTNDFINLELRLNPTVAGTFTYSALTNTPLETATGAITNTVTGGTVIANTYFSLNMNNSKEVKSILSQLNSTINNTMDSIVLCATPALGSNNVKVTGSMMVQWYNQ